MRDGRNPYTSDLLTTAGPVGAAGGIASATDPPFYLLLLEPFTLLSSPVAFLIFNLLNTVALGSSLYLLLVSRSPLNWRWILILVPLAVLFPPLDWHFDSVQNKLLLLFMLVLAMRWLEEDHPRLAGFAIGLASLTRMFPGLLLGYLVLGQRWRVLTASLVTITAGALLTVALIGLDRSLGFVRGTQVLANKEWLDLNGNASLTAIVSRLFWDSGHSGALFDLLRIGSVSVSWLTVVAVISCAALGYMTDGTDRESSIFSLWLVASVLLSPTAFGYDLIFLYVPFAQIAKASYSQKASRRVVAMAIASYALIRNPSLLRQGLGLMGFPLVGLPPILESRFFALFLGFVAAFWHVIDLKRCDRVGEKPSFDYPR
jgi:hypothetical protein